MRADSNKNEALPIAEAAQKLPNPPCVHTVRRWIKDGVRGRRLEGNLIGGRWYVTGEALEKFICATPAPINSHHRRPPSISEAQAREINREFGL